MELKTLKDFKEKAAEICFSNHLPFSSAKAFAEYDMLLKSEAIKWVKYHAGLNSVKIMIDFFNITEEDLK